MNAIARRFIILSSNLRELSVTDTVFKCDTNTDTNTTVDVEHEDSNLIDKAKSVYTDMYAIDAAICVDLLVHLRDGEDPPGALLDTLLDAFKRVQELNLLDAANNSKCGQSGSHGAGDLEADDPCCE